MVQYIFSFAASVVLLCIASGAVGVTYALIKTALKKADEKPENKPKSRY